MHFVAKQHNEELQLSFISDCEIYSPQMMVFVDETGSDERDLMRKFGYSLRGQCATPIRLVCRGKRVISVDINGVNNSTESMNGDAFCEFWSILYCLNCSHLMVSIPELLCFSSIHQIAYAICLIQNVGALVHFLPPYSPDLNPIEELFLKVKAVLKENDHVIQWIGEDCIVDIVQAAFSLVTADGCVGWFQHAGYII